MKDIYDVTSDFPKKEDYRLTSQLTGCAVSMPSNIAEGSTRTERSFHYFLDISLGSSFELGHAAYCCSSCKLYHRFQAKRIR